MFGDDDKRWGGICWTKMSEMCVIGGFGTYESAGLRGHRYVVEEEGLGEAKKAISRFRDWKTRMPLNKTP